MTTIKEIAKLCNVSTATVSNIFNGKTNVSSETKERVLRVAEELNYTPNYVAKQLKMRRTKTIGVLAEDLTVFCTPEIIDGITQCCEKKDYHILLTNLRLFKKFNDSYYLKNDYCKIVEKEMKELIAKQVAGIIYVTAHERVLNCIPDNINVPAVVVYGYSNSVRFPSIVVDDTNAAYMITDFMIKRGYKNIGVLAGKETSIHTKNRILGYQKALFDNNICFNPELIIKGEWTRESGYLNTDQLLSYKVDGIFCMNDLIAGGVYDRLYELRIEIGKEIAVVGFDNREMSSYYKPPLTTIDLPLYNMGHCGCEKLIEIIEKEEKNIFNKEVVIEEKCQIIVRESVQNNID